MNGSLDILVYYINALDCVVEEMLLPIEDACEMFSDYRHLFHLIEAGARGEDYLNANFEGGKGSEKFGFLWNGEKAYGEGFIVGVREDEIGQPDILLQPVETLEEVRKSVTFWN